MHVPRRLALAVAAAAATMALAVVAPAAGAQTVELTNEATGQHCGAVTVTNHVVSGGCPLHAASIEPIVFRLMTTVLGTCDSEFEARFSETGHGYIYNQVFTPVPMGSCPTQACTEGGAKIPWEARVREEGGVLKLEVRACIRGQFGFEVNCHVTSFDWLQTAHDHVLIDAEPARTCENAAAFSIEGAWETEDGQPSIEVTHT